MTRHRMFGAAMVPALIVAVSASADPGGVVKESGKTAGHVVRDGAKTVGRTTRDFFKHGPRTAKRTWKRNARHTSDQAVHDKNRVKGEAHNED